MKYTIIVKSFSSTGRKRDTLVLGEILFDNYYSPDIVFFNNKEPIYLDLGNIRKYLKYIIGNITFLYGKIEHRIISQEEII